MKKKSQSKTKSHTSSVKQRNRLRNKGKLKVKKHVHKNMFGPLQESSTKSQTNVPEELKVEDVMDMVDKDEIEFLKNSVANQKYRLLKRSQLNQCVKKKSIPENDDELESRYEKENSGSDYNREKMLLPIKTKTGLLRRYMLVNVEEDKEQERQTKKQMKHENQNKDDVSWLEEENDMDILDLNEPISVAKLYAKRENVVRNYKFRVGLLASSLLENPEVKIGNLNHLLDIMSKRDPELQITVKKLVTLSLMEVFKDLLPAYEIKHRDVSLNKLKKVTKELMGYESMLLKGYKSFLTKLEKMANYLRKKKGDTRVMSKQQMGLGELSVRCLCELLITHPYFNYSTNIIQLLTIYLDNSNAEVRKVVEECYKTVFKQDKKGLISLLIVRRINHLVKSRAHSVHCEALSVLLSLRIKDVNLDQEKEDEINNKKLLARKQKVLSMSKRERKRKKQLRKLDNEMLEAKGEENKKNKQQHMTEITKIVFLIYFRILKRAPRSNLLTITLEGLAKFAHCINLEFYQDLMNVLDHLMEKEKLNVREQLYCIKTVFIILSGYGDVLNIDPVHFYTHLYRNLLTIDAGKSYSNIQILLNTLDAVLIHRRKKVTTQRMLSFAKRLATVSLQFLHNGSLGALAIIKSVIQLSKAADLLLDVESSFGQGIYNPELNEPEYCNAGNTALWELTAFQRHYHPTVRRMATHIAIGAPTIGEGTLPSDLAKTTSLEFCEQYDPSTVAFKPPIPAPNKKHLNQKTNIKLNQNINEEFMKPLCKILDKTPKSIDFSPVLLQ